MELNVSILMRSPFVYFNMKYRNIIVSFYTDFVLFDFFAARYFKYYAY